ncbi:hypothetical protein EC991_000210 [Linnemannia zychae]|nr:hypothetical protein EC991_000210 [Linnemannia zychae]
MRISDRLLAQLSRLVMMLPVIGVETRAVIRSQVAEVMQQVIAGLKNYETLGRVIRTAVDDAGIVLVVPPSEAVEANHDRSSRNSQTLTNRQDDLFTRDNSQHDQISEYDDVDDETSPSTATTATTTAQTMRTIDESQIPVLTDIAMEAVLDYMAEILTPSLVIRQLTEAIQTALFEISKQRQALHRLRVQQHESGREDEDGYMEDVNGADIELDEFSSQLLGGGRRGSGSSPADRHGVDLLSDGWILAGPSSSSRFGGEDSRLLEDEDEDEDDDPRGQDEDLWDKDMETHQWDSTGRLFEDFEDLEDSSTNNDTAESAASTMSTVTEQDMENWDMASRTAGDDGGDVEEEDDEASDPFSIGIRDNDEVGSIRRGGGTENDADGGEDEDEDDNDPMADTREDYGRERYLQQAYFNRFQKRSLFNAAAPESRKPASAPAPLVKPPTVNTARPAITLTSSATATTTATKTIRRPNLTPDLRLENLLTQLIEPLLTTFIEEDFPASCKRVQGELMDGIIWSLDQGEFNGAGGLDSDEERLLLLSELEY